MLEVRYTYGGILRCSELSIGPDEFIADGYRIMRPEEVSSIETAYDDNEAIVDRETVEKALDKLQEAHDIAVKGKKKDQSYYNGMIDALTLLLDDTMLGFDVEQFRCNHEYFEG